MVCFRYTTVNTLHKGDNKDNDDDDDNNNNKEAYLIDIATPNSHNLHITTEKLHSIQT
jgi:hypothetical protein